MKTFASRIAIAAVIIVAVACIGWFGLKRYEDAHTKYTEQPSDGSINGNVYTNNFFQFTIQFPDGWKALPMDSRPQVSAQATSYVLLIVGSLDRQTHGMRWISVAAARPPASSAPLSVTAEDVAKREADMLKAVATMAPGIGNTFRLAGEPSEISIAGKRMSRVDITGQVNVQGKDYDGVMTQLAIIERGYLVVFCFSDPKGQESDRDSARKAMDLLHFFGKTS